MSRQPPESSQQSPRTDEGVVGKVTKKLKPNEPLYEKASHMAEDLKQKAGEKMGRATEKLDEFKETASEKAGGTIENLKESAIHFKEAAKEKLHDIKESATEKVGEKVENLKEGAIHLKDAAKEKLHDLKEKAGEKLGEKYEALKEKGENLKQATGETLEAAAEKAKGLKDEAVNKIHEWTEPTKETAENLKEKAEDLKETAKEKVRDYKQEAFHMKEKAQSKFDEAKQDISQSINQANSRENIGGYTLRSRERPQAASEKAGLGTSMKDKMYEAKENLKESAAEAAENLQARARGEEEPGLMKKAAQKLGEMAEKFTGRPVVQNVKVEHERNQDQADKLRKEINEEESQRAEEIAKEKEKPEKDMFDLMNQEQWNSLVGSTEKPILVDFYRQDCGNCRRLYPKLMDKFKDSNEEWLLVGANLERVSDFAKKMDVKNVPSLMIVYKGKVIERVTDAEPNLDRIMEKVLDLAHK